MKKLIKGMLLAVFAVAMIGCTHPANSETPEDTGKSGGNTGSGSGSGGSNSGNSSGDAFSLSNYKYTAEVQLITATYTITGSDDYNNEHRGVFLKGRTVTLSPFIMGKYEVTQELYEAVMTGQKVKVGEVEKDLSKNPSCCTSTSESYKNMLDGEEQKYRPVECVTWYDACYFCNALSEKLGLTNAYKITVNTIDDNGNITDATVEPVAGANGYRLPTEAEWEFAARGGEKANAEQFKYYFSGAFTTNYSASENSDINGVAWYYYNACNLSSGNAGFGTHQVGKKAANAAGLCDMSGNVWEWCYDWYATISNTETITDPSGPSEAQSNRVLRGGSWKNYADSCAISCRSCIKPDSCLNNNLGFRVVRNAE